MMQVGEGKAPHRPAKFRVGDRVRVAMVGFSSQIVPGKWESETIKSYLKVLGKTGYVESISDHGCIFVLLDSHGYSFCAEELRMLPEEPMLVLGSRVRVAWISTEWLEAAGRIDDYIKWCVRLQLNALGKIGTVTGIYAKGSGIGGEDCGIVVADGDEHMGYYCASELEVLS